MIWKLKKWYVKYRIAIEIKKIEREKLPIPKEKEEEKKELMQAFEAYKKVTIEQLEAIYKTYCRSIEEK